VISSFRLRGKGRFLRRPLLFVLFFICGAAFTPAQGFARTARVILLHFSDYHSHALPFYSEGREEQGGIARAIGYLRREKQHGALVFSGGDMINKGSPAWSDKYRCAEWPWFDGVVDAMALGNHEPDYGMAAMQSCLASIHFPVLSANTEGFRASQVFVVKGIRVGVFAIAGSDFKTLVKEPALHFDDPLAAARNAVRDLRETQHADVVVMIGHEHLDDDFALARAVPGIDIIFGTHSHLKRELMLIEGTSTWFISPFQYLAYISRVELVFQGHKIASINGHLVPVDARMPADKAIASRVETMQRDLEHDPQYAPLFETIGTLAKPISVDELAKRGDHARSCARRCGVIDCQQFPASAGPGARDARSAAGGAAV
jgi:5'-nucleotidase/UDP-sugar diphosphatase